MAKHIGPDEVLLGLGTLLVSVGCAMVWRPAAFLVPGALMIWIAMPTRRRFVESVAAEERQKG